MSPREADSLAGKIDGNVRTSNGPGSGVVSALERRMLREYVTKDGAFEQRLDM